MRRALERDEKRRYYYPLDESLWPLITNFRGERAYSCGMVTEIDMTEADDFKKKIEKESGVHVSINSLIVKAAGDALENFPILSGARADRLDRIICPNPEEMRIGIPVQIGDTIRGLIIEKASQKGLVDLSKEMNEQIKPIKEESVQSNLKWEETPIFIISNVGTIGCVTSVFGQMGVWGRMGSDGNSGHQTFHAATSQSA